MKNIVKQKLEKIFSDYMIYNVKHYQKKYGFDMDNNSTHNNEADAFKHLCQDITGEHNFNGKR